MKKIYCFANFLHIDENIAITQYPTEYDILQNVTVRNEDNTVSDQTDNEE